MICNHGQTVQYVLDVFGVNSRLDSIQAAVFNAKLPHMSEYEEARNQAAQWYEDYLGNHNNLIIPKRNPNSIHVFRQFTLQIIGKSRDKVRSILLERGISSMVYYPRELHKQKAFEQFGMVLSVFRYRSNWCPLFYRCSCILN